MYRICPKVHTKENRGLAINTFRREETPVYFPEFLPQQHIHQHVGLPALNSLTM